MREGAGVVLAALGTNMASVTPAGVQTDTNDTALQSYQVSQTWLSAPTRTMCVHNHTIVQVEALSVLCHKHFPDTTTVLMHLPSNTLAKVWLDNFVKHGWRLANSPVSVVSTASSRSANRSSSLFTHNVETFYVFHKENAVNYTTYDTALQLYDGAGGYSRAIKNLITNGRVIVNNKVAPPVSVCARWITT